MNFTNIILGGVEITFDSSHAITQSYEPIVAESILRMSNGAAVKQTAWSGKTRITTSGTGKIPLPLQSIDFSSSLTMDCVDPITLQSASNAIALPATRRTDLSSIGFAVVGGRSIRTPISISGNTATMNVVSGASGYEVIYYPRFTVFVTKPTEGNNIRSANNRTWSFVAEEV